MKLFTQKKIRNVEEKNDEGRIADLAFIVHVAGHLNKANKEL